MQLAPRSPGLAHGTTPASECAAAAAEATSSAMISTGDRHCGPAYAVPTSRSPSPSVHHLHLRRLHLGVASIAPAPAPRLRPSHHRRHLCRCHLCQQQHLHRLGLRRHINAVSVPITFSLALPPSPPLSPHLRHPSPSFPPHRLPTVTCTCTSATVSVNLLDVTEAPHRSALYMLSTGAPSLWWGDGSGPGHRPSSPATVAVTAGGGASQAGLRGA